MTFSAEALALLRETLTFGIGAALVAGLWAPALTKFLYHFKLTRRSEFDLALQTKERSHKVGVPIMGGLLVIVTVAAITLLFNWERKFTWVPIGVMLLSALLGGLDDILNIYGSRRRSRKIAQTVRLMRVHKQLHMRVWYALTLPWTLFKRTAVWFGSHPGKGIHVHEKLVLQFIAGAITAWWIYFKLGSPWHSVHIPFDGYFDFGIWLIPIIIFFVVFTANAVNFADGMDGLAGGSLLITFTALTALSWLRGLPEVAILNATVAGALLPYTYFNIKPARFQMGDVGSLGLGALLAINAIVINQMLLIPLLGFIFYVEIASVFIQVFGRLTLGRKILRMAPIHYHYEMKGWSEEKTVMRFWIIHALGVLVGMLVALW